MHKDIFKSAWPHETWLPSFKSVVRFLSEIVLFCLITLGSVFLTVIIGGKK